MDLADRAQAFLDSHDAVLTTGEARTLGITDNGLFSLVRGATLRRAVRGAYVCARAYAGADAGGRHLLVLRAVLRSRPGELAASHLSAALALGMPVLDRDLTRIHVAYRRTTKESCRFDTHTVHRTPPAGGEVREHEGLHVVTPALAVLGTATVAGPSSGLMAADFALRGGLTSKTELAEWLERMRHHPGLSSARLVVERSSPSAESAGESLSRLVLEDLGYRVIPQVTIVEEDGRFVARVDFLLPELGVVVEFDGLTKYSGGDGATVLAAEKRREDSLRRLGYGVVRLVWADLFHPVRVRAAVQQAVLAASPERTGALTGVRALSVADASGRRNATGL